MTLPGSSHHPEPPYSVELLADLDAGLLDEDVAAHIRSRIDQDPDAQETLAALARTRADLSALRDDVTPTPQWVTDRTTQTLGDLSTDAADDPLSPGLSTPDLQSPRGLRPRWNTIALVGAAAVIIAIVVATIGIAADRGRSTPVQAGPSTAISPPERPSVDAGVLSVLGRTDSAPFGSAAALRRCTQANDVPDTTPVLGSGPVTIDGTAQTVILLGTGRAGRFEAFVVGRDCDLGNPSLHSRTIIGG